jgi:hypothetical protein
VGRVLGESPVGVWLVLEAVSVGAPPENLFPDLPKEHPKQVAPSAPLRFARRSPLQQTKDGRFLLGEAV